MNTRSRRSGIVSRRATTNSSLPSHFEYDSRQDTILGDLPRTAQIREVDTSKSYSESKQTQKLTNYDNENSDGKYSAWNRPLVKIDSFSRKENVEDDSQNQKFWNFLQNYQNNQETPDEQCKNTSNMKSKDTINQKKQKDVKSKIDQSLFSMAYYDFSNDHHNDQRKKSQQIQTLQNAPNKKTSQKEKKKKSSYPTPNLLNRRFINENIQKQKIKNDHLTQKRLRPSYDTVIGLTFIPFQIQQSPHEGVRRNPVRGTRIHRLRYWLGERVDLSKKGIWVRSDK